MRYSSPAEGELASSPTVPLSVDGAEVSIRDGARFRNRYTEVGAEATTVPIADEAGAWVLDLAAGRRGVRPIAG